MQRPKCTHMSNAEGNLTLLILWAYKVGKKNICKDSGRPTTTKKGQRNCLEQTEAYKKQIGINTQKSNKE